MKITITGPRSVGKTTISKIVAEKLGLDYVSSDEIGEKAMNSQGGLDKAIKSGAIDSFIKDSAYGLIREVYENKNDFVFDLSGGSISSKKFSEASEKVRKKAKESSIIIGLLVCENQEKSIEILFEREKQREHFKNMDEQELFEKVKKDYPKFEPIFNDICNKIIYIKDKTSEEVAEEVVELIRSLQKE